ncbi:hypothetical protein BH11MYX1_BH11MYX1_12320 [soil metagenome]
MSSPFDMETVAARVPQAVRCRSPRELIEVVDAAVARRGLLDILDLFDHGTPGLQAMGDAVLFASDLDPDSDLENVEIARPLGRYLKPFGYVRLLGCRTALESTTRSGRLLLIKLARALGAHRVVFGTNDTIYQTAFDEEGFLTTQELRFLFSSLAAIDGPAPEIEARMASILKIRKTVVTG